MKTKVSIVTITYNSSKYVRQAIESVLTQSFTTFEYIIGDDCSTDNTWELIEQYHDPRIIRYRNEKNLGEYPNRNKSLKLAKGEYILWIDGDDILYPHGLAQFISAANHFPESAMVMARPYCPFIIYSYELNSEQIYKFDFLGSPVTVNGFPDTLFKVSVLNEMGALPAGLISGDTYIKRKIAAKHKAVLIAQAVSWWRLTPGQASQKLNSKISGICEAIKYNRQLLANMDCPLTENEKKRALTNMIGSFLRKIVYQYFFKFKWFKIIRIIIRSDIKPSELFLIFIPGKYDYTSNASASEPLTFKMINQTEELQ